MSPEKKIGSRELFAQLFFHGVSKSVVVNIVELSEQGNRVKTVGVNYWSKRKGTEKQFNEP